MIVATAMAHILRRKSTLWWSSSLREEWIAALSTSKLRGAIVSQGTGYPVNGGRKSLLDGKIDGSPRVSYLPAGLASKATTDARVRSYDPLSLKWRGFMSLDHSLNVLKDDVKTGSESFIENRKAMEELLLDLQQKVEKVSLQI